jgi:tRNA 5-methylaminomethyl-2-thiouridine biosynthesis bifunctional protein
MKIENAKITWLKSGLPYSTEFEDIYYSREDAIAESQHVFLEANKLRQRWEHDSHNEAQFSTGDEALAGIGKATSAPTLHCF